MPGKSGLELLSELSVKNFEVIFVTAHNEYILQALQYSAADYLLKPVDEDRLIEAVQRVEKKLEQRGGKNVLKHCCIILAKQAILQKCVCVCLLLKALLY